jgi:pimeloyl-ACP methyl ester carboxylesterase
VSSSWDRFLGFWRRLEDVDAKAPIPPPLPPGRIEAVPGRGEMLVRELPGRPGQPTILLLHGWTLGADLNWFTVYDAVAPHGRVLAIDQRGHGRGLRSEQPFTLEDAADDAAALLEHLGGSPAIVVGYSMGGSVALVQAHRHPATVAGLVLQSTGLQWRASARERVLWSGMAMAEYGLRFGAPRGLTERYLRMATQQRPDLKPHLPWLKAEVRRGDPTSIAAASRALSAFDARAWAGSIEVPAVVVISKHDRLIRPRRQQELADTLPGAVVTEVDAAHNGWMVKPEEVAEALAGAVESVAARLAPKGAPLDPAPAVPAAPVSR